MGFSKKKKSSILNLGNPNLKKSLKTRKGKENTTVCHSFIAQKHRLKLAVKAAHISYIDKAHSPQPLGEATNHSNLLNITTTAQGDSTISTNTCTMDIDNPMLDGEHTSITMDTDNDVPSLERDSNVNMMEDNDEDRRRVGTC
jgi:hypothetical protein